MAVAYSTAAAGARLDAFTIATSQSAGVSVDGRASFGKLVIGTSGLSGATGVLSTTILQKPSFSRSGKTTTLQGVPLTVTPSAGGTAALAELRDSDDNTVVSGLTVGTSASNIIVTTVTFSTSIPLSVTSGTITSP